MLFVGAVNACTPANRAPPVGTGPPVSRTVSADAPAARARVEEALREAGFALRRDDDTALTIVGENPSPDAAWADCPLALARDPDPDTNRRSFERPVGRRAVVVVRFMPLGGRTITSLELLQAGAYRNPYVGMMFEECCRSTGALEVKLLDAAEGAGPAAAGPQGRAPVRPISCRFPDRRV